MTMLQKSHDKTRKLVSAGMLSAISIILGMTPLGIIPIGPLSATTMHLPVIIGAVLEGPVVGLIIARFSADSACTRPPRADRCWRRCS